jgi:hypothetical protein
MGRVHRRPPIDSMMATMAITSAKARMARGPWYLLGIFMVFDGADHRLTGVDCNGMRCFATENDRKGKINSQAYFVAQSERHGNRPGSKG